MTQQYRPDIDGLRAIAVVAVLLFHADLGLPGGYVGVDVFFVISGYLITGLVLKEIAQGSFTLAGFWERRVRRILPALAVVVAVTTIVGWRLLLPQDFKELGESVCAQSALLSNVYFWIKSDYFSQGAAPRPLLHTWSLAVEEQFYFILPVALLALKGQTKRMQFASVTLASIASFVFSVYGSYNYPSASFYLLPSRGWELLLGSLLAIGAPTASSRNWMGETIGLAGLSAILIPAFLFDETTRFPGLAAAAPVLGTAAVIWTNESQSTKLGALLSNKFVVFLGLISYSLYLWHWPVLTFAKYATLDRLTVTERALCLMLTLALAIQSWRFVEIPFRKQLVPGRRSRTLAIGGAVLAACFASGVAIHLMQGMPGRVPEQALTYAAGASDISERRNMNSADVEAERLVEFGLADPHAPVDVLVWGDSHAMAVLPVFDMLCKEHGVRGVAATHVETPPLVNYENRRPWGLLKDTVPFNDAVARYVNEKRVANVVLAAMWSHYMEGEEAQAQVRDGLRATIDALPSTGCRIWIMKQAPRQDGNVPRALATTFLVGGDPDQLGVPVGRHREECRPFERVLQQVADRRVQDLDPVDALEIDPVQRVFRAGRLGKSIYYDDNHLSKTGALLLKPVCERVFAGTCGRELPAAETKILK